MKWLLALVFVPIAFFFGIWLQKPPVLPQPAPQVVVSPTPSVTRLDSDKLWSLINNWRESQGLSPFIKDQRLCDVTTVRLKQITTDWSHNRFDSTVNSFFGSYKKRVYLAENLAKHNFNNQFLLDSWLASPSHRANLVDNYKHSCVVTSPDGFAVQIFANF